MLQTAQKSILVLGMHRSGTSLIAEMLHRWGAYGGEPGDMPPPTMDNPAGYWEYLPLVGFNDEILAAVNSTWYLPPLNDDLVRNKTRDTSFHARALSLLDTMSRGDRIWYWKDPRMPLLLPFWSEFLYGSTIIIPLRNPLDIVASLKKRENRNNGKEPDKFPASAILLLWQYTMLKTFSFIENNPAVFLFDYDALINDPHAVTARLCTFLDSRYGTDTTGTIEHIAQAVQPGFRRNRTTQNFENTDFATAEQKRLWRYLCERVKSREAPFQPDPFPLYNGWREYLEMVEAFTLQRYEMKGGGAEMFAQLFIDTGAGFNENESVIQPVSTEAKRLMFDLGSYDTVHRIRFDPFNKESVLRIKNIRLLLGNGEVYTIEEYESNAFFNDTGLLVFSNNDPFIIFTPPATDEKIQTITFDLEYIAVGAAAQPLIIEKKGLCIQDLHECLRQKENDIAHAHDLIRSRDHEIRQKEQEVAERDLTIRQKEQEAAERDLTIRQRDQEVAERDLTIRQKEQEVAERDLTIRQREQEVAERDLTIRQREQEVAERDLTIRQKEQEVAQKIAYINHLLNSPSWKVTAPFRWLRRTSLKLLCNNRPHMLFRSTEHLMRLIPANDLEAVDGGYRVTGPDPQFLLQSSRGRLPHGWVRISYEASSPDMVLTPKLYMHNGAGFSEQDDAQVQLPKVSKIKNAYIHHIAKRTEVLRLDPVEHAAGLFSFSNVRIRETGYTRLACALITVCCKTALSSPALLPAVPGKLWSLIVSNDIVGLQHVLLHGSFPDNAKTKRGGFVLTGIVKRLVRRARLLREYYGAVARYRSLTRTTNPHAELDIIIPAYRGLAETRACLESILRSKNTTAFEIIVIDDASPELELSAYLRSMADRKDIILLQNESNRGFVYSANLGMCLHPDRDIMLLNSDTAVANDWVDRLRACALSQTKCATVSPMTNRGTICSYPVNCADNDLPPDISLDELDRLFAEQNPAVAVEAPTAVGFCMFIRRAAIRDIGIFDERLFGRGYGEENDFCMRALHRGWKNSICGSVFVEHHGSVSFLNQKDDRCREAIRIINDLYPDYLNIVGEHCSLDPLRPARLRVEAALLRFSRLPKILFINHNWGGGIETHLRELAALLRGKACLLLVTGIKSNVPRFDLRVLPEGRPLNIPEHGLTYEEMVSLLQSIDLDRIHYHHTIGMDRRIYGLHDDLQRPHDMTAHDYFTLCPRINLVDEQFRYCGEPDTAGCIRCISTNASRGIEDVVAWRDLNRKFIRSAERVFCPTLSVAERMRRHFPEARVIVAAHPDAETHDLSQQPEWSHTASEPLRIALLGAINDFKGRNIIAQAAQDAEEKNLPLFFTLIGDEEGTRVFTNHPRIRVTGKFKPGDFKNLLEKIRPHIAWFPAQCPETYSYTLSEAFRYKLPVATTDLGALPERTAGRTLSWSLPWTTSPAEWNRFFCRLQAGDMAEDYAAATKARSQPGTSFRYSTDYLQTGASRAYTDLRMSGTITVGAIVTTHADMQPDPCAMIRVLLPLRHRSIADRLSVRMLSPLQALKHRTDVLLVQRTALPDMTMARRIVEHCQEQQITMLYETDDDLFMMTAGHPEYNHYSRITAPARYYIEHARAVIVSTPYLRKRLAALHPHIHVLPNALDEALWAAVPGAEPPPEPPADPIRILYMGTLSHHHDLQLLKEAVKRLKKHFGKAVVFETVGVTDCKNESWFDQIRPPAGSAGDYERFVPWLLAQRRWHIGVAPLAASEFNTCKSFLKYLDYAALGCCGVFSDCPSYREVITDERNGLLAGNTPEQWYEALKRLVEDTTLRENVRTAAYHDVTEHYTLQAQRELRRTFWLNPELSASLPEEHHERG